MITHSFSRTHLDTLVTAEVALAEFLDEAREMAAVGDLQPSLFAELSQLKAQIAVAVEKRRPVDFKNRRDAGKDGRHGRSRR